MEKYQLEQIQKLLPELLQVTVCSPLMITELSARKIFSLADTSQLEAIPNVLDRTIKMFQIVQTRVDGYKHLIESLKHTSQTGALKLLIGQSFDAIEFHPEKYFKPIEYNDVKVGVKRLLEENEDMLEQKRKTISMKEKILFFNVRPPSKLFTGRSNELDMLHKAVGEDGATTVISQSSSITGLGGIGKTELAKKFIHSIDFTTNDPIFNCIIWINADTEAAAEHDLRTFATSKLHVSTLNANGVEEEMHTVLDKIYTCIKYRRTLLIFDNMENPDILERYKPCNISGNRNVSMLITSQTGNWDIGHHIRLSGMEEADAIEFVKKGLGIPKTPDSQIDPKISKLVSRLQYLPLAISQAIAYIKNKRIITAAYGPLEYILDLETRTKALFSQSLSGSGTLCKKTIYKTVEMTLAKIEEDGSDGYTASRLLKMTAYLAPENITETMLQRFCECLDNSLILLERYSVINIVPRDKNNPLRFSIHRLVQDVLRTIVETKQEEKQVLLNSLELLENNLNFDSINHAISIWKYSTKYTYLVKKFCHYPAKLTALLNTLMRSNEAHKFASDELVRLKKMFSYSENGNVLVTLEFVIGENIYMQGKYFECKEYVSNILENALKYLCDEEEIILRLQTLLVTTLGKLYLYDEAINVAKKAYNIWNRVVADEKDNSFLLDLLLNMGNIRLRQKRLGEALVYIEQVTRNNGKLTDDLMVRGRRLWATIKSEMGEDDAALKEMQAVVEYATQHFHPTDKRLLIAKNDLGVHYYRTGKIKESVEAFRLVYEDYLKFYGPDQFDTLFAKQNFVGCLAELGPSDNLLSDALETYEGFKRLFGENFFLTFSAYVTVGVALFAMEYPDKALFIFSTAMNNQLFISQATVFKIQQTKLHIALCLEKLGRLDEALEGLKQLRMETKSVEANDMERKITAAMERLDIIINT